MNKEKEIEKINSCINELVYDKVQLKKAYNYYHCKRDAEQFAHIEDQYGIGSATTVGFTPLIKKHIDVLVGEYLELDPDLQISCKDDETISTILQDKKNKIHEAAFNYFKRYLQNSLINVIMGTQEPANDPFYEREIKKIKDDLDKSYVSDYEIAAQNILNFFKNSRSIDMKNKLRELFTDLLISGTLYYRVKTDKEKNTIKFYPLNPIDTFIERNPNEFYLNKSPRAVSRRYLTEDQVRAEFGKELSGEAKSKLHSLFGKGVDGSAYYVDTSMAISGTDGEPLISITPGILGGLEVTPNFSWTEGDRYKTNLSNRVEVYECEWIETDSDNVMQRHEGIRIGGSIYICRGEVEDVPRSVSNPNECELSINGLFLNDKNGSPFSLILNTMSLQDEYDLLCFYRDTLIATSGTIGDWIDVAHLPEFLGEKLTERLEKWISYKKTGVALFDSSQEGAQALNTTFNGFDDSIKAPAIQAIQLAIQSIEEAASSITGVFAEKLGGIQQRDAVSNVKVGIRQSTLLTKQYFSAMDLIYKEVNYDLLNIAKIVYKDGIKGTLILGNRLSKIFTALPEHYTMTDFDIHIQDSTEVLQIKETMMNAGIELIKSGQADASMMVNMALSKNARELKNYIEVAVAERKEENNQLQQLQDQLQQMQQQSDQLQKQLEQVTQQNVQLQKEVEKNNAEKLEIEKKRVMIEEQKANDSRDYNERVAKTKEKQVEIEYLQLTDSNPYNDKVKNV